ncbi:hypothetical protein H7F50_11425 [Novosphingobium flavum]|uniref:Uncharacterized protein n=1 Tax=Novosphingobium aerophilum TaxID=2839843 RepID=A0A7X1FAJ2_9SPHN|nr:hypothetical protein [Novosphingobium aerophilum]MBC2653441.1 hypothetical protein [Novosphingobium aerophilum]MBC2662366.1 hypothetical protein [Novosphingobium aerophilum]
MRGRGPGRPRGGRRCGAKWRAGRGSGVAWGLLWLSIAHSGVAGAEPAGPAFGPPAEQAATKAESPPPDDAVIASGLMISPAAAARRRRAECAESRRQGEIVVCGADRGEQWRVPSTTDSDPRSRQGMDTGVPSAPNVSSLPDCTRVKCRGFGKVPPPVYVVDFSKLPQAPAGSDADRIAKGEAPDP